MQSDKTVIGLYRPPEHDCQNGRCLDMMPSFIYCVLIPVLLLAIFLVLLIIIMCCSRKACKCKKYSSLTTETNNVQMESYNTIRRASFALRQMSQNRETAIMGSRSGSMTLDRSYRRRSYNRCNSAPGTLQKQHRNRNSGLLDQEIPPPPAYSMISGDPFFGSGFLQEAGAMQSSVYSEDNPDQNGIGAQPLLYQHNYQ